jgi:peptide chain release factor subunit 1
MSEHIDLKRLSRLSSHERAFLSVYIAGPESVEKAMKRIDEMSKLLKENRDEHEYLKENKRLIKDYFERKRYDSGGLCIFSCWILDYFEVFPLAAPVENLVRIDSSPYLRPLAEMMDEYENYAVVVLDNERARIFIVAAGRTDAEEEVKGNIKNHVKVGGWSQKRYERRREKELERYAEEVVERLEELANKEEFRRIILVGGKEAVSEIAKSLPPRLAERLVGEKSLDLKKGEDHLNREIFDLFVEEERRSEVALWDRVKESYFRGEPAVMGIGEVLEASQAGRVDKAIVNRDDEFAGRRCRDCENLSAGRPERCPACGSQSLFDVDLLNEIVELLSKTGAEIDFADRIEELEKTGGIAALLRY